MHSSNHIYYTLSVLQVAKEQRLATEKQREEEALHARAVDMAQRTLVAAHLMAKFVALRKELETAWLDRRKASMRLQACVSIQSRWRSFKHQRSFSRMRWAVGIIQNWVR